MKRLMSFLSLAVLTVLIALAFVPAQLQAQSALTFKVYPSIAPNRHTADNSNAKTAYNTWVGRAMTSVEGSGGNIGNQASDPAAYNIAYTAPPRHYLVTANYTWRAVANPGGAFYQQQGNRLHFVLHVKGNGTVRFKYEDISWAYWDSGGLFTAKRTFNPSPPSGYTAAWDRVDCTHGWGYDWGADRAKGGTDDVKVCGGDRSDRGTYDSTLVDELFYVGPGFGLTADKRFNNPSQYPTFQDHTLQEVMYFYCDAVNNTDGLQQIGMKFDIVGSDSTTYTYTKKLNNPEYGAELDPETCAPPEEVVTIPPTLTPTAVLYTAEVLQTQGYSVSAAQGLRSGVQAQQVGESGVGIQEVLDAGFIDAVDVWGNADQTVTVCFPQSSGSLVFLDASTSPRTVTPMAATVQSGMICGTVTSAGTIVLVNSWPGSTTTAGDQVERTVSNCMVTTQYNLNFRDGPAGSIIGLIPEDSTLTAVARTDDWFKVDYYGVKGWISAAYVDTRGTCD